MSKMIVSGSGGQPVDGRIGCAHRLSVNVAALVLALMFGALVRPSVVVAQKGKAVPGYALHVLPIPPGFGRASVRSINDNHEMVGTAGVGFSQRAVYWPSVSAAPVLLPCPTAPCVAQAINSNGVVSGTANSQAVVWRLVGGVWSIEALLYPGEGDPAYQSAAYGLLDDGTVAGFYALAYGIMYPNDIPVRWSPLSPLSEYPVPEGFFSGRALRANQDGDAVGELRTNNGSDPTYVYGVIWVEGPGGYQSVVLTASVNGITSRSSDGSFLVSSTAGRIRVSPSGSYVVESSLDGPGLGINQLGDVVGCLNKKGGYGYGGVPYLLLLDGTLTRLPVPTGATGCASSASTDRWAAGDFLQQRVYYPAVWRPQ